MKYLIRKRKGVSPIIATLLLIVIAVAAAVVTYGFVTGFIGTSTGNASQTGAMSYDTYSITSNTTVDVWVRNTGTKVLTISTAYVDGASATPSGISTMSPGTVQKITVTAIGTTLLDGLAHQLRIMCIDGTPLQLGIVKS